MFCQNCGKKLRENAKFCSSCGAKIENFDPTQNFLSSVQTENADNLSETVIQHTRYGDSAGNSIVKPYKSNVDLKKIVISAVLLLVILLTLSGLGKLFGNGGKNYEKQLIGEWYADPEMGRFTDEPYLTIFSDGTYTTQWGYGVGHWSIVNDDQLKLVDFYGYIENLIDGTFTPMRIISIRDNCLVLETSDGNEQVTFYDEPVD